MMCWDFSPRQYLGDRSWKTFLVTLPPVDGVSAVSAQPTNQNFEKKKKRQWKDPIMQPFYLTSWSISFSQIIFGCPTV